MGVHVAFLPSLMSPDLWVDVSDSRRFFHDFFLEKVILYGEVTIKSRWLEAKPLKFSPPKSLCGTVGSP